jgi:hypothetical protein
MEAHGAAWSTHRGAHARSLPHSVIVAGAVIAALAAGGLFIVMLATARATESAEQRRKRWTNALTFLTMIVLIIMVRLLVLPLHPHRSDHANAPPATAAGAGSTGTHGGSGHTDATWWPLVIVGLGTAAVVAAAQARRVGTARPAASADAATLEMLDASLDDLRTEPDARRAVIAAYARMERGLAAQGFARIASETPTEYLRRALATRDVVGGRGIGTGLGAEPIEELTALAEQARFSAAAIDEPMRSRAIAALESLRAQLRARDLTDVEHSDLDHSDLDHGDLDHTA